MLFPDGREYFISGIGIRTDKTPTVSPNLIPVFIGGSLWLRV
jgi:hypothetical protein